MKNNTIPLALSFRNSKIKKFKMFYGSNRGAIETQTSEFDLKKLWGDYVEDSYFDDSMLIFIDDSMLCIIPGKHTYQYRFEKRVLKVYDIQQSEWVTFGYGDKNKLVVVRGLTRVENQYGSNKLRVKNRDETIASAFAYARTSLMDEMKDNRTKIFLCNIHYTFQ